MNQHKPGTAPGYEVQRLPASAPSAESQSAPTLGIGYRSIFSSDGRPKPGAVGFILEMLADYRVLIFPTMPLTKADAERLQGEFWQALVAHFDHASIGHPDTIRAAMQAFEQIDFHAEPQACDVLIARNVIPHAPEDEWPSREQLEAARGR
jgi:hypothetical protein